jgi:predicted Zn finger-like uncharacterized protein
MKLVCDRCKATYSIADDKVRGKVVSLRCKTCGELIQSRGPGATADKMPTVEQPPKGDPGKSGAAAAAARSPAARSSVLDRPLRHDKGSLRPTADLTRSATGAAAKTSDEALHESAVKRHGPLDEPAYSRVRPRAEGEGPTNRVAVPPQRPAVGRFASDEGGKLKRAAAPAAGARSAPRSGAPAAGAAERRPAFGAGARGGSTEEGDDAPKTTIASYDSIVAALGAATSPPPDEWYLSVDGDQRGPYTREALEEEVPKYDDQELYVWREGFDDWKPPAEVPELEIGLRLTPPPSAGVIRGAKLPAAERAEALKASPWGPAPRGVPEAETEPPWKGQSKAEPLPPPPSAQQAAEPVPRKVAKESSGAEVVSIQAARERAASRPHRGGTPLGTAPAKHEPGEAPRIPGAGGDHAAGARAGEHAGHDAVASPIGGAALPLPAPEPDLLDDHDLVVTEPSQVVRMRSYAIPTELEDAKRVVHPYQDLDRSESGVHGRIDELAVAAGVVQPTHHKTNRLLLYAAVGGALATLSLAGVVVYLVGRGPQVQVREIVRLKSPEELGADSEAAVARLLAEKQFNQTNPGAGTSATGAGEGPAAAGKDPTGKKVALRPTAGGGPAPAKKGDPKASAGTGMAGFFKSQPGTGAPGGVAAPNLTAPPPVAQPAGRRVSDDEIVKAINRQRGTLSVCYNRALKHDNTLKSVRLDVTVKFGYSGRPTSVVINDSKHRTSFLGQCLTDTIRRWTFPSGGDDRTTVMPLVLQGE